MEWVGSRGGSSSDFVAMERVGLSSHPRVLWIPYRLRDDPRLAALLEQHDLELGPWFDRVRRHIGEGERFAHSVTERARGGDADDFFTEVHGFVAHAIAI